MNKHSLCTWEYDSGSKIDTPSFAEVAEALLEVHQVHCVCTHQRVLHWAIKIKIAF